MKRTPKNYDGINSPARTLCELLPEMMQKLQKSEKAMGAEVLAAWPEMIGEKFSSMTRAVSFVNGVLTVNVKSSSLYSLLCTHEKPHLLGRLQERFPKVSVQNIIFRIG